MGDALVFALADEESNHEELTCEVFDGGGWFEDAPLVFPTGGRSGIYERQIRVKMCTKDDTESAERKHVLNDALENDRFRDI